MYRVFATVLLGLSVAACQTGYRVNSPEGLYSKNATQARNLQVPPDLTSVAEGEQFVLPGTSGGAITRNTLLPESAAVRFVRQAGENYLEIQKTPEEVWPQLQEFLSGERLPIAKAEPLTGVMSSQWRELGGQGARGALKNLLGTDATVMRVAFRVERGAGNSTRLFSRQQVAANADVQISTDDVWPPSSHDPENTSELMIRLMVFFGVQEQRARGILKDDSAAALLQDATLESTASDTWLVVYRGYQPAFRAVDNALKAIAAEGVESDGNIGRLNAVIDGVAVSFRISAVNVSAARVTVNAAEPLTREQQQALLGSLRDQLV